MTVEFINTYKVIIKSHAILDVIVNELNQDYSASALERNIEVTSAQNTQVVNVTVTDSDIGLAANIANATVEIFREQLPDLMSVDNVGILSEAEVPLHPTPESPKPMLNIAIALVLGGMIGVGLAFLLDYLDTTIKKEDDVKRSLEIPVIGNISEIEDKDMIQSTRPSGRGGRERVTS